MKYLLDVNALLAAILASHSRHQAADTWLRRKLLATCPLSELGFLRISTNPKAYNLSMANAAALPAGAGVEVVLDGLIRDPKLFDSTHPGPYRLVLRGNPSNPNIPAPHWVRVRVLSPSVQQPDLPVTLNLAPVP